MIGLAEVVRTLDYWWGEYLYREPIFHRNKFYILWHEYGVSWEVALRV